MVYLRHVGLVFRDSGFICRCLTTQCVNLSPRGHANYENREKYLHGRDAGREMEKPPDPESFTNSPHPLPWSVNSTVTDMVNSTEGKNVPEESPRLCGSVDPTVLKYTRLINEIRGGGIPEETLHETNFGSIRFDNENIPKVHGQYDLDRPMMEELSMMEDLSGSEKYSENSGTEVVEGLADKPTHEGQGLLRETPEGLGVVGTATDVGLVHDNIDELYFFEETRHDKGYPDDRVEHKEVLTLFETDVKDQAGSTRFTPSKTEDPQPVDSSLNYIDDIMFGDVVDQFNKRYPDNRVEHKEVPTLFETDVKDQAGSSQFTPSKTREPQPVDSGLNYIDTVVFGDAVDQFNSSSTDKHSHQTPSNLHRTNSGNDQPYITSVGKNYDSKDHSDLNYIDEIVFKDLLETYVENKKSTVEFSEIESDLNNPWFDKKLLGSVTDGQKGRRTIEMDQPYRRSPESQVERSEGELFAERSYTGIKKSETSKIADTDIKQNKQDEHKAQTTDTSSKSAYDFVIEKRKEAYDKHYEKGSKYKKILKYIRDMDSKRITKDEVFKILKHSIIYDKYDIVALNKPYGLNMHPGTNNSAHVLLDYLPALARHLRTDDLYPVHRLDTNTTDNGEPLLMQTLADTKASVESGQYIITINRDLEEPPHSK